MNYQVGLVGVGNMGRALLSRLIAAGAKVRAFDVNDSAMQAAREEGAETVASFIEAARGVKIIHIFVNNDQQVFDATLGDNGVLAGTDKGATVILHSTIMPETTKRVAEAALSKGIRVIDAPITSVPNVVRAGDAVFLVGGSDEDVAEIRPYLENLGRKVWHFGPLGSGNAAKLVKNLSNAMERVLWIEALTIVQSAGIDPRQYAEMLKSVMRGSAVTNWEKIIVMENGEIGPKGPGDDIFRKDVPHAAKFSRGLGLKLALTQGTADSAARWVSDQDKVAGQT
jgi:3-hydroxyisobutyrate dehydrogenase